MVSNYRRAGDHDLVDVRTPGGEAFTLTIDGATRLPRKVASPADYQGLGDVTVETEFADYQAAGALKLPTQIISRVERKPVSTIRLARNTVSPAVGKLAAPAPVSSAGPPDGAVTVKIDQLAPGVWLMGGGSHHSVLVEFAEHLTLIEAPEGDARTLAVIAKARELRPDKPLTGVVSTHHHFDHSGGVRAAVSEGLTIIAHQRSAGFLREIVSRPHTIVPDALAKKPSLLKLETVSGEMSLEDSTRRVQLYAAETPHAETMLVAYLPGERLLVEVDLYTPPPPDAPKLAYPHAPALLRLVKTHGLKVDRVVPLHRQMVPFATLVAATRR